MEKSDWVKIIVVAIVLLFITELFYFGQGGSGLSGLLDSIAGLFGNSDSFSEPQNVTGTAVFNGTIRTYDPILALSQNTSQQVIDELRNTPGVKSVQAQDIYMIVQTETRDDVYPLALSLRQKNVTAYSVANIALPPSVEVSVAGRTINASTSGAIVRVQLEPLLDVDSDVTVSMVAVLNDDQLIAYQSARVLMERISLQANATVSALNYRVYTYSIPWENRSSIVNQSGYDFKRMDTVRFDPQLDVGQVVLKRQLPYMVYIDSGSAVVEPSFGNATRMREDFPDVTLTFPQSTLRVLVNGTDAPAPDLPFSGTATYSYIVVLPPEVSGYETAGGQLVVETPEEHGLNTTIQLNISALAMGRRLVSLG